MSDEVKAADGASSTARRDAVFEEADYSALNYQRHGKLFSLLLKTALLTLITLGIYRFWQKTRLRRYYWSATTLDGDKFEYTGTGLEKFIGFLIAVIIMALYLLIATFIGNFLFLSTLGLGLFDLFGLNYELSTALTPYAVLILLMPFIYYAEYRALRYRAGRTEWRAIRFGSEKAAWGYVWRSLGYLLLMVASLGLLLPYAYYKKSKYKLDRVWFGDAKFTLEGNWKRLFRYYLPYYLTLVLFAASFGFLSAAPLTGGDGIYASILFFISLLALIPAYVYYVVRSRSHLISMLTLGKNGIAFHARLRARRIFVIYLLGLIAIFGFMIVFLLFVGLIVMVVLLLIGVNLGPDFAESLPFLLAENPAIIYGYFGGIIFVYAFMIIGFFIIGQMVIFEPILTHIVNETAIINRDALSKIQQRAEDDIVDADGFADALDIGAGF